MGGVFDTVNTSGIFLMEIRMNPDIKTIWEGVRNRFFQVASGIKGKI